MDKNKFIKIILKIDAFLKFVAICTFTFLSNLTWAEGRADHFTVKYVRADRSGKGYVVFDKPLANSPATCGTSHKSHLAFNTNTPGGQAILSLALTAHSTGKRIQAYGTGNCPTYGSVEDWNWGFIVK